MKKLLLIIAVTMMFCATAKAENKPLADTLMAIIATGTQHIEVPKIDRRATCYSIIDTMDDLSLLSDKENAKCEKNNQEPGGLCQTIINAIFSRRFMQLQIKFNKICVMGEER